MPTPSNASNPLLAAFAPWLAALPSSDAQSGIAGIVGPAWAPSLESQARLWAPWIEAQRNFWSMYTSFFQSAPAFLNGGGKTVAEDEAGLEAAETSDGIPDALELQMRTWNHFLDANRSFWTAISWPGAGGAEAANEASQNESAAVAPARAAAPRKKPRAKR